MQKKAVPHHATLIRKGRVFDFCSENVTLPNGRTMDMDMVRHPGAAAMVPVTDDGKVLLLKQYRYAAGGFIWEIPAGTLNPGEDPYTCAGRELIEETGYAAGNLEKLTEITPTPGYSDERIHIYLATGLTPSHQHLDPDEILSVHPVPLDEALAMVADSRIQDAKTIVGLYLASLRLKPQTLTGK
ncbi:NUDIX hydrolase [Desulfosarcina sp. OttesenSCG-928-A07]|nr:NUDIX hydrolase [Desulfosarcina sp. OttesenSCG-928-G17]MDL2329700.1 NUDIX hydrolase [Desulfosarcina sp. OttesenSCG-928-A07]